METKVHIGELYGGGLVLGYSCSSRCRHCLYGCGPHRRDGGAPDRLDAILDQLAEVAPHARYHIGGGEPFLNLTLVEHAVRGLGERGLHLEYIETNASWVRSRKHAEETLAGLAAAGLRCVLVSVSPFHAEFVPYARTRDLIAAARDVLPGGAFVWIPDFIPDLERGNVERTFDLEGLLAERGDRFALGLADRYGLVLGGRAGRYAATHGQARPWRQFSNETTCRSRLSDTGHFHVDLDGLYVPGLCAGIALPLDEVPGELDLTRYPALAALVSGGPAALVEVASELGFEPLATYSAPCDLCTHVRGFLHRAGFAGLGPAAYYDPRSVGGFDS